VFICKYSQHLLSHVAVHFSMATVITMHVSNDETKSAFFFRNINFNVRRDSLFSLRINLENSVISKMIFFFYFFSLVQYLG